MYTYSFKQYFSILNILNFIGGFDIKMFNYTLLYKHTNNILFEVIFYLSKIFYYKIIKKLFYYLL